MSYLVLARKYRPQTFDEVVKQEHVTRTLKNAISSGRVAHAILFAGPRGTGKTTVARILAKSMNCAKGPTTTPCNECRSCMEITHGNAADVFEIDGASNNGVDHIRELRENIKYMPAHSPNKIYIIDEVHMLSVPAFNALLKTLEEPPSHIMFLFATTEPNKIPITILSRCQRHDLRRIDIESIIAHMDVLCRKETVDIDHPSLEMIARKSGGSMRDALSLLDQVVSCSDSAVTGDKVSDILDVVDRKLIFEISAALLDGNVSTVLEIFDEIYHRGHNIKELYFELVEHFRNLLIVKKGQKLDKLVDVPSYELDLMKKQVDKISELHLSQWLDLLFREEVGIKLSEHPKLALEIAFIRMFQVKPALPIETLIEKIDVLKKTIYDSGAIVVEKPVYRNADEPTPERTPRQPVQSATENTVVTPSAPSPDVETIPASSPSPARQSGGFTEIKHRLSSAMPALSSTWDECHIRFLDEKNLEIDICGNDFTIGRIKKKQSEIQSICCECLEKNVDVVFKVESSGRPNDHRREAIEKTNHIQKEAFNHPLIMSAIDILGGKVEEIKILQEV